MLITLITQEKYLSLNLPKKCSGKYWLIDEEMPIGRQRILGVEADENRHKWRVQGSNILYLFQDNKSIKEIILEEDKIYPAELGRKERKRTFIVTEAFSENNCSYATYFVKNGSEIKIGSAIDCDISIQNIFVSKNHATLRYIDEKWELSEDKHTNGIYVNKRRVVGQSHLEPGDLIYIFGCKIVIGYNFIAINNPKQTVRFSEESLRKLVKPQYHEENVFTPKEKDFYYRSPNYQRSIIPLDLKVDMPVAQTEIEDVPVMLTLAPSMIMGVAAFSSGIFSFINTMNNNGKLLSSMPTMIMAVAMLVGMIIFPIIMKNRERQRKIEKENTRRKKYIKYLNNIKNEIKNNRMIQEQILRENHLSIKECVDQSEFWEGKLWSRMDSNKDFLSVRLGVGNEDMQENIRFPEERFSIDDDYLREELLRLQKSEKILLDVPVCVSLIDNKVVGLVGENKGLYQLVHNILIQIFLMHSYDEVKVVCIYEPKDEAQLSYVRIAKHLWDDELKTRFLATNETEVRELSGYLKKRYEDYKKLGNRDAIPVYYVIFSVSKYLANKCEVLEEILSDREIRGFSLVCAYDKKNSLPKESSVMIEVNENQGILFRKDVSDGRKKGFIQDEIGKEKAYQIVQKLSGYQLDMNRGRFELPDMMTFMDMFHVGKCEHLNVRQRWIENNPVKSLKAAVGVDTNGETFYLDLHEKCHGPHGLVAGMTGSGKSEFIITYVLSMAVNYHPDEVAFVLIDYKGGGLAGAFDNEKYQLPHLAGTITNLDGNAITRSIYSIRSELRRRQQIFNQARMIANEGTMDIYKYQKMYREHIVDSPLPHLIIIADEFAELKSQQSEFLEQLISTARIGRSLGVHLILATQKPSGVVNDQIWANSKFKVCLKVQDRSDSMDMLKKPDAAEIAETGRFYLQVGYDELFELGQSAWSGAPYDDHEITGNDYDDTIEMIDNLGNVTEKIRKEAKREVIDQGKQIVRVMEYLNQIAIEDHLERRPLWLPEIPDHILLLDLIEKYGNIERNRNSLVGIIGELDNPYEQSQELLTIDFTKDGNAVIYGAADSGEDLMINAIIYSLSCRYDASFLNVYMIDFGTEALKVWENVPHIGGVLIEGENERMDNFFSMMAGEMKRRKKKLKEYGGNLEQYFQMSNEKMAYILIVINNYSHFFEEYEQYEENIITLLREGIRYGIYFLVTANAVSAIRYRMLQNFRQFFCLKLNDKSDYTAAIGNTDGVYPNGVLGRGVVKHDKSYIFQTADIIPPEENINQFILDFGKMFSRESEFRAPKIPLVPKMITSEMFVNERNEFQSVPLGVSLEKYETVYLNMKEKNILLFMSQIAENAARCAYGFAEGMQMKDTEMIVINVNGTSEKYMGTRDQIIGAGDKNEIIRLKNRLVDRNNIYKTKGKLEETDENPIVIVIHELSRVFGRMGSEESGILRSCLERVESICNVYIVISDSYQGIGKYSVDNWYTSRIGGEGVWVGNGINDQIRLLISKKSKDLRRNIDDYTGYYVQKGEAVRLRLIMPEKLGEEEKDDGKDTD